MCAKICAILVHHKHYRFTSSCTCRNLKLSTQSLLGASFQSLNIHQRMQQKALDSKDLVRSEPQVRDIHAAERNEQISTLGLLRP